MAKLDNTIFGSASDAAMAAAHAKTVNEKLKAMGSSVDYSAIINKLQSNGVNAQDIAALETTISTATDKNIAISNVVKKGGTIAKVIVDIVRKL